MIKNSITISGELASELEEWGRLTAKVFGKLRNQTELKETVFKPLIPLLKRPKHIPRDQAWFWSDEWQKGEQEANQALKNGEYEIFEGADTLLKDLHRHV